MNLECLECGALHWKGEKPASYTRASPQWETCCKKVTVTLPLLKEPPALLKKLVNGTHRKSAHYLNNCRQYNSVFAFTSFGTTGNIHETTARPGYMPVQVHGELYHLQGPINSNEMIRPSYNQLYIYDPVYAARIRSEDERNTDLDSELIEELSTMLHIDCNNPFVSIYKHAHEILKSAAESQMDKDVTDPLYIRLNPQ